MTAQEEFNDLMNKLTGRLEGTANLVSVDPKLAAEVTDLIDQVAELISKAANNISNVQISDAHFASIPHELRLATLFSFLMIARTAFDKK